MLLVPPGTCLHRYAGRTLLHPGLVLRKESSINIAFYPALLGRYPFGYLKAHPVLLWGMQYLPKIKGRV